MLAMEREKVTELAGIRSCMQEMLSMARQWLSPDSDLSAAAAISAAAAAIAAAGAAIPAAAAAMPAAAADMPAAAAANPSGF